MNEGRWRVGGRQVNLLLLTPHPPNPSPVRVRDDTPHARALCGLETHDGVLDHHAAVGGHAHHLRGEGERVGERVGG